MKLSRKDIRTAITHAFGQKCIDSVIDYVQAHPPDLWGETKPDDFLKIATELAIYKDREKVGYGMLAKAIKGWLKTSHKSLNHNQRVLRGIFEAWAKKKIKWGTFEERQAAVRRTKFKKPITYVTLWLDSTDFPLTATRAVCCCVVVVLY
jgi:hypothetical protein